MKYFNIGERIKKLRENMNMSQDELARRVGYKSRSSINKIEMNKQDLTQSQISKIASVLNVSVETLLGSEQKTINKEEITLEEQALLEKYRQLKEDGKEMVNMVLNREFQFLEYRRKMESIRDDK